MKKIPTKHAQDHRSDESADADRATETADRRQPGTDAPQSSGVPEGDVGPDPVNREVVNVAAPDIEPDDTIESLRARVASLEDALLRAKADFENFRKRGIRERSDAIRYANAELIQSLLGVIDDFERALAAGEAPDGAPAVVDGVRLTYENLMKSLRACGLESIDAVGEPFDPHVHEAIMMQPTRKHEPGRVIEQVSRGYRLQDRVLRPARVIVATADTGTPAVEEADAEGASVDPDER